tara:strand:+ start:686 stop:955 length:270 start_codon:yes stop_codon:yes gene_type:complete
MFGTIARIATAPGRMAAKAIAGSPKTEGGFGGQSKPEKPINDKTLESFQKSAGLTKDKDGAKKFLSNYIFGAGRKERRDPVEDFKISRQ